MVKNVSCHKTTLKQQLNGEEQAEPKGLKNVKRAGITRKTINSVLLNIHVFGSDYPIVFFCFPLGITTANCRRRPRVWERWHVTFSSVPGQNASVTIRGFRPSMAMTKMCISEPMFRGIRGREFGFLLMLMLLFLALIIQPMSAHHSVCRIFRLILSLSLSLSPYLKHLFIGSDTRAASRFITLPKPRTGLFKTTISFSGASLWNTIPTQIKSCNSLISFKKHSSTNGSEAVCCK